MRHSYRERDPTGERKPRRNDLCKASAYFVQREQGFAPTVIPSVPASSAGQILLLDSTTSGGQQVQHQRQQQQEKQQQDHQQHPQQYFPNNVHSEDHPGW